MTYINNFAQPPGETSHDYTPCFSTAAAAARLPRRILGARGNTALHFAAWNGHAAVVEQLISAVAKVDAARKTTAVAPERFSGRFGSGSDEMTEGVRTLAGDFRAVLWDAEWCLVLKDPYVTYL